MSEDPLIQVAAFRGELEVERSRKITKYPVRMTLPWTAGSATVVCSACVPVDARELLIDHVDRFLVDNDLNSARAFGENDDR